VGEGLQLWRAEVGSIYAGAMRSELGAAIDRRLAELIILRLRRNWPLLKLLPASWIIPIVAPGAKTAAALALPRRRRSRRVRRRADRTVRSAHLALAAPSSTTWAAVPRRFVGAVGAAALPGPFDDIDHPQ
jgi:hypothetical protein